MSKGWASTPSVESSWWWLGTYDVVAQLDLTHGAHPIFNHSKIRLRCSGMLHDRRVHYVIFHSTCRFAWAADANMRYTYMKILKIGVSAVLGRYFHEEICRFSTINDIGSWAEPRAFYLYELGWIAMIFGPQLVHRSYSILPWDHKDASGPARYVRSFICNF